MKKPSWKIRILFYLILFLVVGLMFTDRIQNSMTYFPSKDVVDHPKNYGISYEDVFLQTSDDVTLHAWYIPSQKKDRPLSQTLIFFHGNAGNLSDRTQNAILFVQMGVNVLLLDYRGYGKSTGKPHEQGLYVDALTAYQELTENRKVPAEQIILFGRSLGGAVAVHLAAHVPIGKLIVESTFTGTVDLAKHHYPFLPLRLFMKNRFNTLAQAEKCTMPKLMIHGTRDTIAPFTLGEKLFQALPEPKEFFAIKGADHNNTIAVAGKTYLEKVSDFLNR